jgi:hypothetical protein
VNNKTVWGSSNITLNDLNIGSADFSVLCDEALRRHVSPLLVYVGGLVGMLSERLRIELLCQGLFVFGGTGKSLTDFGQAFDDMQFGFRTLSDLRRDFNKEVRNRIKREVGTVFISG